MHCASGTYNCQVCCLACWIQRELTTTLQVQGTKIRFQKKLNKNELRGGNREFLKFLCLLQHHCISVFFSQPKPIAKFGCWKQPLKVLLLTQFQKILKTLSRGCAKLAQLVRSLTTNLTRRFRVQSRAWSRDELSATFFRQTVRGQGR